MNDTEKRIAIGEFCGAKWVRLKITSHPIQRRRFLKFYNPEIDYWLEPADGTEPMTSLGFMWREGIIPDYSNDLNSMHQAEKVLTDTQLVDYQGRLAMIASTNYVRATSEQRADALIQIICESTRN